VTAYNNLLRIRAFNQGRSVRRRALRHGHLDRRPLVLALVQMAGEPFSVWGFQAGTRSARSTVAVAPDARNGDDQVAVFEALASVINEHFVDAFRDGTAPQVIVTNPGAATSLRRIGRAMRVRNYSPEIQMAGANLDFLTEAFEAPRSTMCVAATTLLAAQRVTGQSPFEDANLATQLVWWDPALLLELAPDEWGRPEAPASAIEAAPIAERLPMGHLTDPEDDRALMATVAAYNQSRRAGTPDVAKASAIEGHVGATLESMWTALWLAVGELAKIPESTSAARSRASDETSFDGHMKWMESGGFRRQTDTPMRAAQLLARWEFDRQTLERNEVVEDDFAFIEEVAAGGAAVGRVISLDRDHRGLTPAGSWVKRPLATIEMSCGDPLAGTEVWWRDRADQVRGNVVQVIGPPGARVIAVEIDKGMKGDLPEPGQVAAFLLTAPPFGGKAPAMPSQAPWTHRRTADV